MGHREITVRRWACDWCGASADTEDEPGLPQAWIVVSIETKEQYMDGTKDEYEICDECAARFRDLVEARR